MDERLSQKIPDPHAFSKAVAAVERHRRTVRGAVFVALGARLFLEFDLVSLTRNSAELLRRAPNIGFAILAYLVVIMYMARNAGDRLGFGMGLGLGVLQAAYVGVALAMQGSFALRTDWKPIVVAVAHLPMVVVALHSARAYPPQDTKAPWIVGFLAALLFLSVGWIAPSLVDAIGS
jgi:hypothetical protein